MILVFRERLRQLRHKPIFWNLEFSLAQMKRIQDGFEIIERLILSEIIAWRSCSEVRLNLKSFGRCLKF